MSDPRFTDPRYSDPRYSDLRPMGRKVGGGVWDWLAVVAVAVFIAIVVVAGKHNQSSTADHNLASITDHRNANAPITSPSTTGLGSTSPHPHRNDPLQQTPLLPTQLHRTGARPPQDQPRHRHAI